MALKRNERYPGRFGNPNAAHPQGAFKNRTSPTSQDGSYLESDWANDWDGFFARLLTVAGVTANGNVDTGTSSQYYDALVAAIKSTLGTAAQRDVGTGVNQIPDMNSFTSVTGDQGRFLLPGGMIIQYVKMAIPANVTTNTDRNFTWATAMTNTMACWCSIEGLATLRSANIVFVNNSGAVINYINNSSITTSAWGFCMGKV